jgi:hypothetical protein
MTARRALAAATIAGVMALVAAGLSAGGGSTRSLVLDVRLEKTSFVTDDVAPKGRSVGDTYTFSGSVTRANKPFGRYEDVDVSVDGKIQGFVRTAMLLLPDGTIAVQGGGGNVAANGWKPGANDELAVVGGTGAYAGVSGTLRPDDLSDSVMRLTIKLSP